MKTLGGEMVHYAAFMHVIRQLLGNDGMTQTYLAMNLQDTFPNMSEDAIVRRVQSLVSDGDLEKKGEWLFAPRANPFPGSVLPN